MRITTFGAATATALAAAAMLAVPATANATDVDFNSGVKLSVTRDADNNVNASVKNPTGENLGCGVIVGDKNLITTYIDLAHKHKNKPDSPLPDADQKVVDKAAEESKVLGAGYGLVEAKKTGTIALTMEKDDDKTSPEGLAVCTDEDEKIYVTATVAGGLIGSIDFGGSLAGNTGSISSLDFGGSLGL